MLYDIAFTGSKASFLVVDDLCVFTLHHNLDEFDSIKVDVYMDFCLCKNMFRG